MSALSGKVAIITGGSSGIGEAAAVALGQAGVHVVSAARRADRLEQVCERVRNAGGRAIGVPCDVSKRSDVNNVVDSAHKTFGRVDILINNAGIMPLAPMAKARMDDWDDMIDINLKGLLYGVGFVLPIMLEQKSGHIINISSTRGTPGRSERGGVLRNEACGARDHRGTAR